MAELPRNTETICVVDDEEAVRLFITDVLQKQGYTILPASNGRKALQVCENHKGPIHLLVSDVVMPVMGGVKLAEMLCSTHPGIKVLLLSGFTDDKLAHYRIRKDQIAFLQKPVSPEALVRKVREVLDGQPGTILGRDSAADADSGAIREAPAIASDHRLTLQVVDGTFAICKLADSIPSWATAGDFFSITRTADELSVVCQQGAVPEGVVCERDWRCLRVAGAMPFSVVAVLASLTAPLAEAGISVFAISTFDTDYLLVKEEDFERATAVLEQAGHATER